MAAETNRVDNPDDYERLFAAVKKGDWRVTKEFLTQHPNAITATDSLGLTALHTAASYGHEQIVEELVQLMTDKDLEIKCNDGWMALAHAVIDNNLKTVECMVAKNKKLLGTDVAPNYTPILMAAVNHRWDVVRYLYSITPPQDLGPDSGSRLVICCLFDEKFDIVCDLLLRCPHLACTEGSLGYPIAHFPYYPSAFPSGTSLKFWQWWIYKCIHVKHAPSVTDFRINVQNQEKEQGDQRNSTALGLLQGLPSRLSEILGINRIRELKLNHVRFLEMLDRICDVIKDLNDEETRKCHLYQLTFIAVEKGNPELAIAFCKAKPELFVQGVDGKTILHYAVECRQEKVYSLIYGASTRNDLTNKTDDSDNGMLHFAGMLSPLAKEKLDLIPGAALQMQRERQWYKEVESIVVRPPGETPVNKDGFTAAKLFTKDHKELHEKGEKWMKDTASSYIIVSALVITIMFAAAFTVPGGNNQETGFPIFLNEKLFMVFIISDAISLFSSATSALMFLCILTSRYAEDDFLKSLPTRMIIGLSILFISVAAMMVAFSSALFIMLRDKSWTVTPTIFLASVPVILFVWMQFPLLVEIFVSTYGRGIFNRNVKCWI